MASNVQQSQDLSVGSLHPSKIGRLSRAAQVQSSQGNQSGGLVKTNSEPTPLLNWLDRTTELEQPTVIHRRLVAKENLRNEAVSQETQDIEALRNILLVSHLKMKTSNPMVTENLTVN